ncbi:MAG: 4Fe-4S binding protein [Acidobacteria bacterium]|nr:MAG: 4Fe-4S binding protein [Acidobacteriota bacterium]
MLEALFSPIRRYTKWLHTRWPAGHVEKLPDVQPDGSTNVPGLYVVGDLTGIPLLKLSLDTGAKAVRTIAGDPGFQQDRKSKTAGDPELLDLLIVGAGVGGMAAAREAETKGLRYAVYEAKRRFQTIADFPKAKPIYTYPKEMTPAGKLQVRADIKEDLLAELLEQTKQIPVRAGSIKELKRRGGLLVARLADGGEVRALRAIVAIGRSGQFRKLNIPGEERDKVYNRLHDPLDFAGKQALVTGGGDSALETAIALTGGGADVTLVYRRAEFSRPKPENIELLERLRTDPTAEARVEEPCSERETTAAGAYLDVKQRGTLDVRMSTRVTEIHDDSVVLEGAAGQSETLPNDAVFSMLGREAPLDFFRRAGVKIRGETRGVEWIWVGLFFVAIFLVYDWKGNGFLCQFLTGLKDDSVFPNNMPAWIGSLGSWWQGQVDDRSTLIGTIAMSMKSRSFYYTLAYTLVIAIFGFRRIRRRKTPYVTVQTTTLFLIQLFPLFLLPELILPWMGYNGAFDSGFMAKLADTFFESYIPAQDYLAGNWPEWGHPRAYWRAYGLILAWPLSVYNVFTAAPLAGWLIVSVIQTFVLIPLIVWRWGKGAYCGWICSCGALAETAGDTLRDRMPHGPRWNRLNMVGQALLAIAFVLLAIRIGGWIWPETWMNQWFPMIFEGKDSSGMTVNPLSWKWTVDVIIAGVIGVGLYVKYSGRVWCRFACPLAALMHIYARFSSFRIFAEKKKCISCNVCTSVCHQGIDVMNFANKGLPMADPQCVRCSACVQSCPTGVLSFGRADRHGRLISIDSLSASPVQQTEL